MSNSSHQKLKSVLQSRRLIVPVVAIFLLTNFQFGGRVISASRIAPTSLVTSDITTAPVIPGTLQVVENGPDDQTDPHVDCNLVSYTSVSDGSPHIKYYDLLTNTGAFVPTHFEGFLSDVRRTRIGFTELTWNGSEINIFDTSTKTFFTIPNGTKRRNPSIGGDLVAFEDRSFSPDVYGSADIVVYDLSDGTTTHLTHDPLWDSEPVVSPAGDAVVFQKCQNTGSGCDIYSAIRNSTGEFVITQLTGPEGEESNVDTDSAIIVYESVVNGERNIAYQPMGGGGVETQIVLPGNQLNPSVADKLISFESQMPDGGRDIFVYDTSYNRLYRLPPTPRAETLNDITFCDGQFRIVYGTPGDVGDLDVIAFTFQPPEAPADEIEDLIDLVLSFDLEEGLEGSLIAKLQNALDAINAGDVVNACNALDAFVNEVEAQSGKKIPPDQADQLINSANEIKQAVGCQ